MSKKNLALGNIHPTNGYPRKNAYLPIKGKENYFT